jgi:hypothetical protein
MPYIGLQSEWFVAMEDAVPALEAAIAASKEWPGWVQKRGFCAIFIENDLFTDRLGTNIGNLERKHVVSFCRELTRSSRARRLS